MREWRSAFRTCEHECVRVCTYTEACFFSPLFLVKVVVSRCVYVPVWAHWLLSPPLPYIQSGEQQRECVQACLCVCVRNAEQLCSPPRLYEKRKKKKKSHSQEATLKYQVLIWQNQATGVFTFQRLRREKDQMPPWAASIQRSLTSPWVTDRCVSLLWVRVGGVGGGGHI